MRPRVPGVAATRRRDWRRRWRWAAALGVLLALVLVTGPSKTDLYAAASAARASFRYDRALSFYTQAARLDPDDPRPHCLMGDVLTLQQRYSAATTELARCQRLGDGDATVWLSLGDVAHDQGNTAVAERDWLRAAALGNTTARRRLGQLYEDAGRFDQAAAQWSALGSQDGEAQGHLGLLALRRGDYNAARAAFVAAREAPGFFAQDLVDEGFVALAAVGPTDGPGLASVGIAFVRAGMATLALEPLQQAIALEPTYGPAHAYLAWAEWTTGQPSAASAQVAIARRLMPTDSFTLFVAAEQEMAAARWSAASADLGVALSGDNRNPILWAAQARAALGQRDYLRADLDYTTAAQLGSESQETEELLSFYISHRFGMDDGRALNAANTAVTRWPNDEQIQVLAAQVYDLAGQPVQAYTTYQRANQLNPADPMPYFQLGREAYLGGDYDTAALDLRTVMALRPGSDLANQAEGLLGAIWYFDV